MDKLKTVPQSPKDCDKCEHSKHGWCDVTPGIARNISALKVCPKQVALTRSACIYCAHMSTFKGRMLCNFWERQMIDVEKLPTCPFISESTKEAGALRAAKNNLHCT